MRKLPDVTLTRLSDGKAVAATHHDHGIVAAVDANGKTYPAYRETVEVDGTVLTADLDEEIVKRAGGLSARLAEMEAVLEEAGYSIAWAEMGA